MNTLFQHPEKLPNGQLLNHGDVVKCQSGPWVCIDKVYEKEGFLYIRRGPGAHCYEVSISHLVSQLITVEKMTPVEVYKFCKRTGFANPAKILALFK